MKKNIFLIALPLLISKQPALHAGMFGLENNPQTIFAATALFIAIPSVLYKTCIDKNKKSRGEKELEKFIAAFKIPQSVDSTTLIKKGSDIDRLINAYRAKRLIEIEKFKHVDIPYKYAKKTAYDTLEIYAQKITPEQEEQEKHSLAQVKDLAAFVELSGLSDFGDSNNVNIINANKKFYLIDTESNSFGARTYGSKAQNLNHLKIYFGNTISDNASNWLDSRIDELNKTYQDSDKICATIPTMADLYPISFDTQLIKKQLQLNKAIKQHGVEYVKERAFYNELRKDTGALL